MQVSLLEPPKSVQIEDETIDDTTTEIWLQLEKAHLTSHDKFLLTSGARLNDHYINYAQNLLKKQDMVSNIACGRNEIKIFDSVFSSSDAEARRIILNFFQTTKNPKFTCARIQKLMSTNDCGLFAKLLLLQLHLASILLENTFIKEK